MFESALQTLPVPAVSTNHYHSLHLQIWDIYTGNHLFTGMDPEFKDYRSRQMLAEMIAPLGPPPPTLLARGSKSSKFFTDAGQ